MPDSGAFRKRSGLADFRALIGPEFRFGEFEVVDILELIEDGGFVADEYDCGLVERGEFARDGVEVFEGEGFELTCEIVDRGDGFAVEVEAGDGRERAGLGLERLDEFGFPGFAGAFEFILCEIARGKLAEFGDEFAKREARHLCCDRGCREQDAREFHG